MQLCRSSMLGSITSSHLIPMLLPLEPLFLMNSVWMLNGRVQMLLRLCSSTICREIDSMYISGETQTMHAIFWCSKSCDCKKDQYDKTKFLQFKSEPLLWEYSTKSSTDTMHWSRQLSKHPTEVSSGLSFSWSLPPIWAEVSEAPKSDYSISQMS